jgi:uncharacterized protein YcsI (UPF0317 family)
MELLLGTQMYYAPGSNSAYIVYSEGRFTPLYNAVVYKCDIDCEIVGTLGGAMSLSRRTAKRGSRASKITVGLITCARER